jgi:predicted transcriptional regulator
MTTTDDGLTDRQRDVLRLHREGKSPTEIGKELGFTSQGVHGHLRRLRQKDLIEGTGRTKPVAPPNGGQPTSPAAALETVRSEERRERRGLVTRKEAIAEEIAALEREREEIDGVIAEIDAMVKT